MIKNLPAMQETWVRSLGWEDPLEKGIAAHSNILAWRIPWTEEPGGLLSMGSQELDTTEQLTQEKFHLSLSHKSNCLPYFHFFPNQISNSYLPCIVLIAYLMLYARHSVGN